MSTILCLASGNQQRTGERNRPIADPGWPTGAAAIFNHVGRVAWWEGPPFGGEQWHSECRGDATAVSAVLAGLAKLDVKRKRVIVHDGVGHSFCLNRNREPAKPEAAKIDWVFMVWQPQIWEPVDAGNQIVFLDVTPGRYVILGHPNPSGPDLLSKPFNIELKPGQASRITLSAKIPSTSTTSRPPSCTCSGSTTPGSHTVSRAEIIA